MNSVRPVRAAISADMLAIQGQGVAWRFDAWAAKACRQHGGAEAGAGIVQHRSGSGDILIDAKTMLAAVGSRHRVARLRDVDDGSATALALRKDFARAGADPGAFGSNGIG